LGVIDALAKASYYLPSVEKPAKRLSLYRRIAITGLVLLLYLVMADTPLYGVQTSPQQQVYLLNIIFAANAGTLMELGIGPIVTAGLILQILVGAKIIDMDLTKPEDRRRFTAAQKTLALLFGVFEATAYVLASRYWPYAGNPITGSEASWGIRLAVVAQLSFATLLVLVLDEMLQKGWGIGSAISLFILAGVARTMFWDLLGYTPYYKEHVGLIPYLIQTRDVKSALVRNGLPDFVGLAATLGAIALLVYLQSIRVEIPITSQRFRGIRSKVPLNFLYVTNIPILLVGIVVSDIQLFRNVASSLAGPQSLWYKALDTMAHYLSPPRGLASSLEDPTRLAVFALSWLALAVVFGYLWVEVAGLSPRAQAETIVKSGLDIPGVRRNPKVVEQILAKYIYPLTIVSSLIVAAIAITADIFGAYGSGTGILLGVGIVQQYYALILRERALEAYPLLRRILGEEV